MRKTGEFCLIIMYTALFSKLNNFIKIRENRLSYRVFVSTEFQMSHRNGWFYALLKTESRPRDFFLYVTVQIVAAVREECLAYH